MICVHAVTDPERIYNLLLQFDGALPHLKEKVADYRGFSQKLARFARVLVAVEGDEICGFVVFYANDLATATAFVTLLACSPERQGQGLGRLLMENACSQAVAAGMRAVRLEVDLDNSHAIGFYSALGFVQVGERMSGSMYLEKKLPEE